MYQPIGVTDKRFDGDRYLRWLMTMGLHETKMIAFGLHNIHGAHYEE